MESTVCHEVTRITAFLGTGHHYDYKYEQCDLMSNAAKQMTPTGGILRLSLQAKCSQGVLGFTQSWVYLHIIGTQPNESLVGTELDMTIHSSKFSIPGRNA